MCWRLPQADTNTVFNPVPPRQSDVRVDHNVVACLSSLMNFFHRYMISSTFVKMLWDEPSCYRCRYDLAGKSKRDLGKRASSLSHMNTMQNFYRKITRRRNHLYVGRPGKRDHMNRPYLFIHCESHRLAGWKMFHMWYEHVSPLTEMKSNKSYRLI
jgi:hypothetical protein